MVVRYVYTDPRANALHRQSTWPTANTHLGYHLPRVRARDNLYAKIEQQRAEAMGM
jgi:hypothetical protein